MKVRSNGLVWQRRVVCAIALALVILTALALAGHGINVVRHSSRSAPGTAKCSASWVHPAALRSTVNFSDLASNKIFAVPVQVNCGARDMRQFQLSFSTYDGRGNLILASNERLPLHEGRGILRLSAGDLAAMRSGTVVLKPELVTSGRRFRLKALPLTFHVDVAQIGQRMKVAFASASPADPGDCRLLVDNADGVVRYGYPRLVRQPTLSVKVQTACPALAGKLVTYHVVGADGQLFDWNVIGSENTAPPGLAGREQELREATLASGGTKAGHRIWNATVPINIYAFRAAAPQDLHFVVDVLSTDGSVSLAHPSAASQVTVDYDLARVRNIYQFVPRLLPADSLARVPVIYDVYSSRAKTTGFRLSESFLRKPSLYRADSRRVPLPPLRAGNNWHASWLYADTPPAGVYRVSAGFVYDPYAWYEDVFSLDTGTTVLVINPLLFFVASLAAIWLLFRFIEQLRSVRWYWILVYATATAILVYALIASMLLNVVGVAAIVTYWFVYTVWHSPPERYRRVLAISGFAFGLVMELYWGAGIMREYWHAIVLSATLQGILLLIILLPFGKRGVRAALAIGWFTVWLIIYLTIDIYAKFFGQPPNLDVFTYAGQGAAMVNEILGLFGPADVAGIVIWAFFPAVVAVGLYRAHALIEAQRSLVHDAAITASDV